MYARKTCQRAKKAKQGKLRNTLTFLMSIWITLQTLIKIDRAILKFTSNDTSHWLREMS